MLKATGNLGFNRSVRLSKHHDIWHVDCTLHYLSARLSHVAEWSIMEMKDKTLGFL